MYVTRVAKFCSDFLIVHCILVEIVVVHFLPLCIKGTLHFG